MASEIAYRRLRAPREHGQTLIEPSVNQLPQSVRQNIAASSQTDAIEINGRRLADFSAAARVEIIHLARAYSSAYLDLPDVAPNVGIAPLVMAGHQPQLFHAGVWFKNFVLSGVARRVEGVAINLVVDNDTSRVAALRMPTGPATAPRVVSVPLDATAAEIPYEERAILDPALFASFAARTTHTLAGWIDDPLVNRLWPAAIERAAATNNLGVALASARHQLEQAWGLHTLELPLSQVCDTASFAAFALHLLVNIERFHAVYNGALADYRRVHHLRGSSHPVPDLHVADGAWEAPLWIWSAAEPRRRPLFIECKRDALLLSNRAGTTVSLPLTNGEVTESTIDAWQAARRQGVKLRPRALLTTLYARLVLCDLFLHGIGGAKYDQITDEIVAGFFGVAPPIFGTVTATIQLPVSRPSISIAKLEQLAHDLHELPYHPERYLETAARRLPQVANDLAEKQRQIALQLPKGERRSRHLAISRLNARLSDHLVETRLRLREEYELATSQWQQAQLLGSREFAFCLFPEESLRSQLLDLSQHPL